MLLILTYVRVDNVIGVRAERVTLTHRWRGSTARRILRGTRAAVHIRATYAVRRSTLVQAQIDGAVAVVAKI